MFDKVKDLYNLKKAQDEIKKQLQGIFVEYEGKGVKILIRGDHHIEKIEVNGEEDKRLKDAINEANKELMVKVSKKMQNQLSDLGIKGF